MHFARRFSDSGLTAKVHGDQAGHAVLEFQTNGLPVSRSLFYAVNRVWLSRKAYPNMACPGRLKQQLKPAVPWSLHFDPYPNRNSTIWSNMVEQKGHVLDPCSTKPGVRAVPVWEAGSALPEVHGNIMAFTGDPSPAMSANNLLFAVAPTISLPLIGGLDWWQPETMSKIETAKKQNTKQ